MACAGSELNLFLSQLWLGFIIESGRQTMYLESLMTKSTAEKDLNLLIQTQGWMAVLKCNLQTLFSLSHSPGRGVYVTLNASGRNNL